MLSQLIEWDLSDNRIAVIPPGIGKLKNLEIRWLWDNQIDSIPDEVYTLKKTTNFFYVLKSCKIYFFKNNQTKNLESINIQETNITRENNLQLKRKARKKCEVIYDPIKAGRLISIDSFMIEIYSQLKLL